MSDFATPAPWYADGLAFACTRCGKCCSGTPGYVWVNGREIEQIAAHLELDVATFKRRHVRRAGGGYSLRELPGGDCEFLDRHADGTTGCRIHAVRPVQCRTWPFWRSNLKSPDAWQQTARGCPGIGQGAVHPRTVIEAALRENGSRPL